MRVVDLFSGAGGMSYGFAANPQFEIVGAADLEIGKPSTGAGALECNSTYERNVGLRPLDVDLGVVDPAELMDQLGVRGELEVLLTCPPCTGFSRVNWKNHSDDDPRNRLLRRTAEYVAALQPAVLVMENAREVLTGSFRGHLNGLRADLERLGYEVSAGVHLLNRFGLPQQRERALIIAVRRGLTLRTLSDLWEGWEVNAKATHVRRAIWDLPPLESGGTDPDDPAHTCTSIQGDSLARIAAMPKDGGSWRDLIGDPELARFLTPGMLRAVERRRLNQFCDIYGRMAWDRPAPTIKRESCHAGNGRYSHPDQDRMCSVREMAILQGFPFDYEFPVRSRKNAYRNIGDAVPPLISHQLSFVVQWILTGERPDLDEAILDGTTLAASDLVPTLL
jgi:DNA (cytosine-5)-methyltransferase 1